MKEKTNEPGHIVSCKIACARAAITESSLHISAVRSKSSQGVLRVAKDPKRLQANSEDSDLITKTYLYNFDPLKPHFYIVKLGFTGVYIIFLISAQNIDCGYSLEPPRRGGSHEYHNLCFEKKKEKYQYFLSENFPFFLVKFSVYFE